LSHGERALMVEREGCDIPLIQQGELLNISRSSIYYQPKKPSSEEIAIKHRIDEIYTQYPFYGSRRIAEQMKREGALINRKAVQRHMREMGIVAIYPGPNLSRRQHKENVFPYLLRNLTILAPNHVWGIDITYIRLQKGWVYLVAVLDWYSRYVISWELDQTLEMPFVVSAVENALSTAVPVIWNSDQGSHFTSSQYLQLLQNAQVKISMDSKGRALDNIFTERLWRTVKYEEVYLHDYRSPKDARNQLKQYFEFYNHKRLHQALDYRTPAELYSTSTPVISV
jgi:Transposase and inactivated derivatives